MTFAELTQALRAAEAHKHDLRIKRVFSSASNLPASIHLAYSHPLVIAADFNGYEDASGETHRI